VAGKNLVYLSTARKYLKILSFFIKGRRSLKAFIVQPCDENDEDD
jgi:hypothetical protein